MRVESLGSGDAFGSGGRFNSCFRVTAGTGDILIAVGRGADLLIAEALFDGKKVK